MKASICGFLVALVPASVLAQEATDPQGRLTVFMNAQSICKAQVLSIPGAAKAFITANSSSLSDACECAALVTIASKSEQQISLLRAGNQEMAAQVATEISQNLVKCVQAKAGAA